MSQSRVFPFRFPQFPRAYETSGAGRNAQRDNGCPVIAGKRSEDSSEFLRVGGSGEVLSPHGSRRAPKIAGRIALYPVSGDGIAEDLPASDVRTLCRFVCSPCFNALQHGKHIGRLDFDNGALAKGRKDVTFE